MTAKKRNFFFNVAYYWIPILIWAGLIFYLSDMSGLKAGLSTPNEILLRKVVHMFEFGVLAFLVFRLIHCEFDRNLSLSFFFSFFIVLLYATSDEFHQSFVDQRDGNIKDVIVDGIGAFIFIHLALSFYAKKVSKKSVQQIFIATLLFLIIVLAMIAQLNDKSEQEKNSLFFEKQKTLFENSKATEVFANSDIEEEKENFEQEAGDEEGIIDREKQVEKLPEKMLIDVPFSSQAPDGIWDDVHEEACEEMSLIMIKYYLDGKKLTRSVAEREVQNLKDYQLENYGHYKDSSMEELVKIAEEHYGIDNFEIVYNFEKSEIKKQLIRGKPIIVPTAGRKLENPNFTFPGPLYHNLVLIGYDRNTIVTNDPGTRKGAEYEYSIDVLFEAIHDFEGDRRQIEKGKKAMVILK